VSSSDRGPKFVFKPSEQPDNWRGNLAAGASALAYPDPDPTNELYRHFDIAARRWAVRRDDWLRTLSGFDWAPDLAEDIGSARWFRGLGTMLALGTLAFAFWPSFAATAAAPAMRIDAAARDEFRSQTTLPLALGADSGRRMGPTGAVVPLANAPERALVQLTATLGAGDSFERMLQRAGVGAGDAATVGRLVAGTVAPGDIAPGTQVEITLGRREGPGAPRPLDKLEFRARFDLALAVTRSGGALVAQPRPIAVDTTPLRIRGTIGSSLYRSARAAGAPIEAIQQYLQVLDQHLSLDAAIESGDTFDLIVAYKRSASGESQVGDLLFAGVERGGKLHAQMLRWGSEGQFFEASGMGARRTGLIMPVVGRITSNFGSRRHPILGYTRMHAGVDFGAAYGTPIYAVGDASVAYAGWRGGAGNYVRLEHGDGFGTGYAHMSRIAVGAGQRVRAGQVIGYVGSTGLSTGPHLHYELYKGGQKVDPLSVRFTVNNQVDAAELAGFKARLATLKAVEPGAAMASLAPRQAATPAAVSEIGKLGD
jgi:murein DD-endopeptidase MepM/ murein hydrolase activator NlpD